MTDRSSTTRTQRPIASAPTRSARASVNRRRSTTATASRTEASPPQIIEAERDLDEQPPWHQRRLHWLLGAEAAGLGISLIVHLLLLAVAGVTYLAVDEIMRDNEITTVFSEPGEQVQIDFGDLSDVQLDQAGGDEQLIIPQQFLASKIATEPRQLHSEELRDMTALDDRGQGDASGDGSGGFRLLEPGNAVKQGSFTAWTIPLPLKVGDKPKAGDSPRPGQPYHVVIQIKFPDKRGSYKLTDLLGEIIGTDGYEQNITEHAYAYDEDGNLRKVTRNRRIRVNDNVVQLLVRVPGAQSLVKDTIEVESRSLNEKQTLTLTFDGPTQFRKQPTP